MIKDQKKIYYCERCGNPMEYGGFNIFCCVNEYGDEFDYCEECWEKYTTSTNEITNLIIR